MSNSQYENYYWIQFMKHINNPYGVAGLMGNLDAESGLIPYRKQGDYVSGYVESLNYTSAVDSGVISKATFISDGVGYGLAQWTFSTRKEGLFDMSQEKNCSIGDIDLGIEYLMHELNTGYTGVLNTLKNATSIRQASDCVLHDFEKPLDQSESVEVLRCSLGQTIYDKNVDTTPEIPDTPDTPNQKKKMPIWFYLKKIS